jgi:hypothetical protein
MDGEYIANDNPVDVNKIVQNLAAKIAELVVQNAVLSAQIESLLKKS